MMKRITGKNVIKIIAIVTAAVSIVSWSYRYYVEYTRIQELPFYILVPTIFWLLFAGALFLLLVKNRIIRILAAIILIPSTLLWLLSVLVGIYGFKIH